MKLRATSYTFNKTAKTVVCSLFTSLEAIQLITNVTDNIIIYNFADATKGGTLSGTTLTLAYDTTTMADADKLQILVEDGSTTQAASGTVTANIGTVATLATAANQLANNHNVVVTSAPTTAVTGTFYQATQPVSGTVTANAGTNLNTSALALEAGGNLASIKTNTDKIPAQGQALAAASTPVVLTAAQITTLTPPAAITGFATSAKQDTADTSINTLLKPASTLAAVTTVTTVTTLTGTTTLTPGTGATNLGKAEDAAHTSGDVGVFALGVRADTLADVSGATGDYIQQSHDLKGRLMVGSAPRTLKLNQVTTITASTAETTIVTAVASTFLDLYGLIVTNTSATAVTVAIKDATAGTTRLNIAVPAGDTRGFMLPLDSAIKQTTVNNNWTATTQSVTSVIITALTVSNV